MRKLDQVAVGILAFLLVASPMAFGSVHPWAYRPLEVLLFGLVILWAIKTIRSSPVGASGAADGSISSSLAIPLCALAAYLIFQIAPLSPSIIKILSPGTYRVYAKALEGWPYGAPYSDLKTLAPLSPTNPVAVEPSGQAVVALPSTDEVRRGAAVPFAPKASSTAANAATATAAEISELPVSPMAAKIYGGRWRSLSIAPMLTLSSILMLLSSLAALVFTAHYPYGDARDSRSRIRFTRLIVRAVLASGFVVAFVGLIERATWNGMLLWFFVPYDWGHSQLEGVVRARGPFVNPDHLAGFLSMIFPLALACTLYPNIAAPRRDSSAFRILCGVESFIIFVAILLSQSRAGWMGLIVGAGLMLLLAAPSREESAEEDAPHSALRRFGGLRLALAGTLILAAFALAFVGSEGREETAERFNDTVSGRDSVAGRYEAWTGGFAMVRDFPVFGVGLGDWPEIFTRYQEPPWSELYFSEAHNDFLQFGAETGFIGFVLLAWFGVKIAQKIRAGVTALTPATLPVFAGLIAGIAAMCTIEIFDFDLRLPAIALMFAVLIGLTIRLTSRSGVADIATGSRRSPVFGAVIASTASLFLMVAAIAQGGVVYPYNLASPRNYQDARALLVAYPANSFSHEALVGLRGDAGTPAWRNDELERALWLDPLNSRLRDLYVRNLMLASRDRQAIEQIRTSVENSPELQNHFYLAPRFVPWAAPEVQRAIEEGLIEAVRRDYLRASYNLGIYYRLLGRFRDEGRMFAEVASHQQDPDTRAATLISAGEAYARADDRVDALKAFRMASEAAPANPRIYSEMATMVYGPNHDLDGAKKTIERGIANGADPEMLSLALSDAAGQNGDLDKAAAALEQALKYRPNSYQTLIRLAEIYSKQGRYERAMLNINRALEIRPDSADAYFDLGLANEGSYQYFAAEKAYRRSVELAPNLTQYQQRLADFERKLKAASAAAAGPVTR